MNCLGSELDFQLRLGFLTQCWQDNINSKNNRKGGGNGQETQCHYILDASMKKQAEIEGYKLWEPQKDVPPASFLQHHHHSILRHHSGPNSSSAMQNFPTTWGLTSQDPHGRSRGLHQVSECNLPAGVIKGRTPSSWQPTQNIWLKACPLRWESIPSGDNTETCL